LAGIYQAVVLLLSTSQYSLVLPSAAVSFVVVVVVVVSYCLVDRGMESACSSRIGSNSDIPTLLLSSTSILYKTHIQKITRIAQQMFIQQQLLSCLLFHHIVWLIEK
jgi:hypothetical protein